MKKIYISKRIHSSLSSYSTSDTEFYHMIDEKDLDFEIKEGTIIEYSKYDFLNGELIKYIEGDDLFTSISLQTDKTFYKGLGYYHKTPEYKKLVQQYLDKGWTLYTYENKPKELDEYLERSHIRYVEKREKEGYVITDYKNKKPDDFKGGFSDILFDNPIIQDYIGDGQLVYGWMGASERKEIHDRILERELISLNCPYNAICNWLKSSSGRYFMDNMPENDKESIIRIKDSIVTIYNDCIKTLYPNKNYEELEELGLILIKE
jgi:hypothetical protein